MSGLCPRGFESHRRRHFASEQGFMAERSKALDSSSSLHLEAWVRIPLEPCIIGPCGAMDSALDFESSGCRFESCQGRLLFVGSPCGSGRGLMRTAPARWHSVTNGGLAQSVECVLCKHEAPGSKPGFSTFLFAHEQWQVGRVVKAVDSKSTGLRPRQFESGTCRLSVCRFSIVVIAPAL